MQGMKRYVIFAAIGPLLADGDPEVREFASQTIARFGEPAVSELRSMLKVDALDVRKMVVTTLGLRIEGGAISAEAVAKALGRARLLLVLDNCEHLVSAAAGFAEAIVRMCPNATVLVPD